MTQRSTPSWAHGARRWSVWAGVLALAGALLWRVLDGATRGTTIDIAPAPRPAPAPAPTGRVTALPEAPARPAPAPVTPAAPLRLEPLPGERPPAAGWLVRVTEKAIFGAAACYLVLVLGAIVVYKAALVESFSQNLWFTIYGVTVTGYILSRFGVALAYRPFPDVGQRPSVAIVMPAFNEEDALARSVAAMLALDYDPDRLQVVIVNDGSTDGTAAVLASLEVEYGDRVRVIHFERNRGKREAMAAGIRATTAEIVAFVDSDSVLEPDAMRAIVQPFADRRIGAVCGHADVLQPWASWLTRMQAVRYYVAFRVIKSAESVFSVVTCCSGCFAAYRREAVLPVLEAWRGQHFLGVQCTYGDDRSLTNRVLRDWRVVYQSTARSHTIVPERTTQFMRQQLRWKRSWTRESVASARFVWRKHPAGALPIYIGIVLPLLAPFTVVYALYWAPLHLGTGYPWIYLCGIYAMALIYGLYYEVKDGRGNGLWIWGALFVFFYLVVLVWQTYYAIATSRNTAWGTRPSTHHVEDAVEGVPADVVESWTPA